MFALVAGIGALLLARFGILANAFRPGQGKDPGEGCLYTPCIPATTAEQAAQLPWVRQFFSPDRSTGGLLRTAPAEQLTEMEWILPLGLALFLLGFAGLVVMALRPGGRETTFGFVAGAKIGRRQGAGWAVALGGLWSLTPSIGVFVAIGRWEAALGYSGSLLLGTLGILLLVEFRPPGFGTAWATRAFALNLAASAVLAALLAYPGLELVPMLGLMFAFPPFLATVPAFVLAGLLAWRYRARVTARLLAEPMEGAGGPSDDGRDPSREPL
ncbi:hypothetical protein [Paeniglutamicibacter cryotolerans]|uniref:Uncharacterized protein n=1 Tax=Paeniglutamicibacter cryotolerans TaxID=670079 RepID=A0A839QEU3_9MICC|nr:hypothetical protein [Paeniglutamicibacter cryotolerans]MBB2994133.1 hypothetical protein [Paeniglutamicibacter cryotolerans]